MNTKVVATALNAAEPQSHRAHEKTRLRGTGVLSGPTAIAAVEKRESGSGASWPVTPLRLRDGGAMARG